jgi:hypothetical protein
MQIIDLGEVMGNFYVLYLVPIAAIGLMLGTFLFVVDVSPDATGKVRSKWVIWLEWTLYISLFLISPLFFMTAVIAAVLGLFRSGDKNWKLALAFVCLCYALYKGF